MNKTIAIFLAIALASCDDTLTEGPQILQFEDDIKLIYDEFEGIPLVVVGSEGRNLIVSFERSLNGKILEFQPIQNNLPNILEDEEGNIWDVFGKAISGPRMGQKLTTTYSYTGYWFSFGTFFESVEIHDGAPRNEAFSTTNPSPDWLIPLENVFAGAGFEAIKSLENPEFLNFRTRDFLEESFYVKENDLVIGIQIGDEIKAYPHPILNWHEIVNDNIGGKHVAVFYCPFTGTGSVWNREINGQLCTFGVSGLLYNNNILPFDRATESVWSQMKSLCVNGDNIGKIPENYSFIETTWATWQEIAKDPSIVSPNTGTGRDYSTFPYGDYRSNHNTLNFPISFDDTRLPRKERVYGIIIDNKAKVYRFSSF